MTRRILLVFGVLILNAYHAESSDLGYLPQHLNPEGQSGFPYWPVYDAPTFSNYPDSVVGYQGGYHVSQHSRPELEDDPYHQEPIPNIHNYKPNFQGKDYNENPHILPPGGKSIEQLQDEADLQLKKMLFDSRENQKLVGEKIQKLKATYGYGTIGYPGYTNSINYDPIDLGTHNGIDLGSTLGGRDGSFQLPVQMVTVTKTLSVKVPQPYPVKQEIPIPAPFPVPFPDEAPKSDLVKSVNAADPIALLPHPGPFPVAIVTPAIQLPVPDHAP